MSPFEPRKPKYTKTSGCVCNSEGREHCKYHRAKFGEENDLLGLDERYLQDCLRWGLEGLRYDAVANLIKAIHYLKDKLDTPDVKPDRQEGSK